MQLQNPTLSLSTGTMGKIYSGRSKRFQTKKEITKNKYVKLLTSKTKSSRPFLRGNRGLGNPGVWLFGLYMKEMNMLFQARESRGFPHVASNDLFNTLVY